MQLLAGRIQSGLGGLQMLPWAGAALLQPAHLSAAAMSPAAAPHGCITQPPAARWHTEGTCGRKGGMAQPPQRDKAGLCTGCHAMRITENYSLGHTNQDFFPTMHWSKFVQSDNVRFHDGAGKKAVLLIRSTCTCQLKMGTLSHLHAHNEGRLHSIPRHQVAVAHR